MLELTDVHTYYGDSHVLQGVSLTVGARGGGAGGPGADGAGFSPGAEIVVLLGRNGAGKTTTLRSIAGLTPARRGHIRFGGAELTHLPPHLVARAGVAFVASGRRVFGSLTVRQNLALAWASRPRRQTPAWTIERVLATFPKLAELTGRRAEFLSGGEQQMLKLARALLTSPRVLLLDEPTEGLSPAVVSQLGDWLELLRTEGMPVLLTEQNALFALRHADRGYILEKGKIWHADEAGRLRESEEIRVHLGVGLRSAQPPPGEAVPAEG